MIQNRNFDRKMTRKLTILVFATLLLCGGKIFSQTEGYIMKVEGDKVYINLVEPYVKVSDVLSVMSKGSTMKDRNGNDIQIEPEFVGQIKIYSVTKNYSIAMVYSKYGHIEFEELMTVKKEEAHLAKNVYGETVVMIAPAWINWPEVNNVMIEGGYLGDFVSAVLMEHLLKCDKIKLVDRSIMYEQNGQEGLYQKEMNLVGTGIVDQNTAVAFGRVSGARYVIKISINKPDIVNTNTNVPLKFIVQALGVGLTSSGLVSAPIGNVATNLTPNDVKTANINVSVAVSVIVIDMQTNEVKYTKRANGTAKGKPQLSLEYGTVYESKSLDIKWNGGTHFFTQTVTGKAVDDAFKEIGKELIKYFEKNL